MLSAKGTTPRFSFSSLTLNRERANGVISTRASNRHERIDGFGGDAYQSPRALYDVNLRQEWLELDGMRVHVGDFVWYYPCKGGKKAVGYIELFATQFPGPPSSISKGRWFAWIRRTDRVDYNRTGDKHPQLQTEVRRTHAYGSKHLVYDEFDVQSYFVEDIIEPFKSINDWNLDLKYVYFQNNTKKRQRLGPFKWRPPDSNQFKRSLPPNVHEYYQVMIEAFVDGLQVTFLPPPPPIPGVSSLLPPEFFFLLEFKLTVLLVIQWWKKFKLPKLFWVQGQNDPQSVVRCRPSGFSFFGHAFIQNSTTRIFSSKGHPKYVPRYE